MQIHQLPAITSIADADMLAVDSGSATSYITAANLLAHDYQIIFPNTQNITVTADALTARRVYEGFLLSDQAQSTCGVPENNNFYVKISVYSANHKMIELYRMNKDRITHWAKQKVTAGWGAWQLLSGVYSGTITRGAMMVQTDNVNIDADGATGILRICARIATAGTYGDTDYLVTSSIKPYRLQFASMTLGSGSAPVKIDTSGRLIFQSSQTVTANTWLIGQIIFPIVDWGV